MNVNVMIITALPDGRSVEHGAFHATDTPKTIAMQIAKLHGQYQALVNDGLFLNYTMIYEFDNEGIVS